MIVPKDFEIKKRMLRIARPFLEGILDVSEEERETLLRDIVFSTSNFTGYEISRSIHKYDAAYYQFSGKMKFDNDCDNEILIHELAHKLGNHFINHAIFSNAMSEYSLFYNRLNNSFTGNLNEKEKSLVERQLSNRKKQKIIIRPLKTIEKIFPVYGEYKSSHCYSGICLGENAACIETESRYSGAGLFYLRLVNQGVKPEEAEKMVLNGEVPGIKNFSEKKGALWIKILREDYSRGGKCH